MSKFYRLKWAAFICSTCLVSLLFCGTACVDAKSKFETDVQAKIGMVQDKLEKLVEQTAAMDTKVIADRIEKVEHVLNQQVVGKIEGFQKTIQAGTIKYGGAGWVVVGFAVAIILFLGIPILAAYLMLRRASTLKELLRLVTGAVNRADPEVQTAVKAEIENVIGDGTNNFGDWHKKALRKLTEKMGTFAK